MVAQATHESTSNTEKIRILSFVWLIGQMWRGSVFGRISLCLCLPVCLSVMLVIAHDQKSSFFCTQTHLHNCQVKSVYQGHWMKVKVTGAEMRSQVVCLRLKGNLVL